jgi:glycogen synthase
MAVGVPVIGTRVIGSEDAVEDGVTGLLVPYADAPALARAVRRLFDDAELRCRLRDTAAERVQRTCSREQFAAQVEALYRGLFHHKLARGERVWADA